MNKTKIFIHTAAIIGGGSAVLRLLGLSPQISLIASVVCASLFLIYKLKFAKSDDISSE